MLRLFYCVCVLVMDIVLASHQVEKRALLFPYGSGSVLQVSSGISVPVPLRKRKVNINLGAQANYNLPYSLENFTPKTISAREDYEPSFIDISRKRFYKYVIELLNSVGLDGEECLLRSVCEIAEYPMHINDGGGNLLEKIVHFAFTPSMEYGDDFANQTQFETRKLRGKLLRAEKNGQQKGDCENEYSECIISLVDLFTRKYTIF